MNLTKTTRVKFPAIGVFMLCDPSLYLDSEKANRLTKIKTLQVNPHEGKIRFSLIPSMHLIFLIFQHLVT